MVAAAQQQAVPPVAPDTVPADFYDDSNFVVVPALSPRPILRHIVAVWFKRSATQTQRAAEVESVSGVVVGGSRIQGLDDGAYLIRLARDSTHANISAARSVLDADSVVAIAILVEYLPGVGGNRMPADGNDRRGTGGVAIGETAAAQQQAVPAVAPDTLPTGVSANANIAADSTGGLSYVRHHLVVYFHPWASQPQRHTAISAIGGVVVGGQRLAHGDGFYVVRVAADSSAATVDAAVLSLRARPEVQLAMRYHVSGVRAPYRRQHEGQGSGLRRDSSPTPMGGTHGTTSAIGKE